MNGMCICLQCGAVPCPYDHEKDKDQRLRDMNFIVDLVAEKKRLEAEAGQVRTDPVWVVSNSGDSEHGAICAEIYIYICVQLTGGLTNICYTSCIAIVLITLHIMLLGIVMVEVMMTTMKTRRR